MACFLHESYPLAKWAAGDFRVDAFVGMFFPFNPKIRWPFMVAFSTALNAFISTKPLTTVNRSHWELVMSVMADGSQRYSLIHWQLLPPSYPRCCWKLRWIPPICAWMKAAARCPFKATEQISIMFTLLVSCLHLPSFNHDAPLINFPITQDFCSFFQVGLTHRG